MTIDPQIFALLEALGPPLLAVVGTVLTCVISVVGLLARLAWRAHQLRMQSMAEALKKLAEGVVKDTQENHADHRKVWEAIQALRAESEMARRGTESARSNVIELAGTVKGHQGLIVELVEKLSKISGQLEAIFRFVDAPKRATDT